jgi:hypothetical protein
MLKKKIGAHFQRVIELFTPKIVTKLSKIWIWDPGSEIRNPEKTYSVSRIQGVKKAPDPGSGSATLLYCSSIADPESGYGLDLDSIGSMDPYLDSGSRFG